MIRLIFFSIFIVLHFLLMMHLPHYYSRSTIFKSSTELYSLLPTELKFLPAQLILKHQYRQGIFIKSYIEYFKLVANLPPTKDIFVEVEKQLFQKHTPYRGRPLLISENTLTGVTIRQLPASYKKISSPIPSKKIATNWRQLFKFTLITSSPKTR